MPGRRKLTPIEAFELNMSDAHQLVKLVEGFKNQRSNRMRAELRNKVGVMLSLVGLDDWAKKVDGQRGVQRGETVKCLQRITDRRNRIAHQGDRVGRGRAALDVTEVKDDLTALESIVRAIEALL